MLVRARRKSASITWVQGDLLALPFGDGSFDAATVGFGVRNVADLADPPKVRVGGSREMTIWSADELREFLAGIEDSMPQWGRLFALPSQT